MRLCGLRVTTLATRLCLVGLTLLVAAWAACTSGDDDGGCDEVKASWDSECFATELAGQVTGRGWSSIMSEFDPTIQNIAVTVAIDGTLESVAGLPCELACTSDGWGTPALDGTFGEIDGTILGTCRTSYYCGGYPLELSIKGADVTPEWQGALWSLYAFSGAYAYEGAPFNFGDEWNLGGADVPYQGCVPICESIGAECGHDGCGGLCGSCSVGYCDYTTHRCVVDQACSSDAQCGEDEHCELSIGYCVAGACVSSGSCVIDPCCSGTTCVVTAESVECLENCTTESQCASDCCWPLEDSGSVCVSADYCASCAHAGEECSPQSNPCCPGAACIWDDYLGRTTCEPQSAECPPGCTNPYGVSCCRPPFCAGDCVGSPCCT